MGSGFINLVKVKVNMKVKVKVIIPTSSTNEIGSGFINLVKVKVKVKMISPCRNEMGSGFINLVKVRQQFLSYFNSYSIPRPQISDFWSGFLL